MLGNFSYYNPTKLYFGDGSLNFLKDELKNTAIVITCYDRNGEEVKRVTSASPSTAWMTANGSHIF